MSSKIVRLCLLLGAVVLLLGAVALPASAASSARAKVRLGALLYADTALSSPDGQSCASCHTPNAGFADPDRDLPVSQGVLPNRFGGRNSPTAAYTAWSPILGFDIDGDAWVGGMFWDGRATGEGLGSPLADQALGPFLNPIEMHNPNKRSVVKEVRKASYEKLFLRVWGRHSLDDIEQAYDKVALAIAAYESSRLVNTFSSRFDLFQAGLTWVLTTQEQSGMALFNDPDKGNCNACHPSEPGDFSTGIAEGKALFTDYTYDNLGIPQNPEVVALTGSDAPDPGLGAIVNDPAFDGAFKVSTLRNIALTAPYGHNGYFATLEEIVHFYNTRDVPDAGWPAPEYPLTMNTEELGNLGLEPWEEDAIVAFLETLTDQRLITIPDR